MSENILQYQPQDATPEPFPEQLIVYPKAWTRETLRKEDYLLPIPASCLDELRAMAGALRANPVDTLELKPGMFRLPACTEFIRDVKRTLDEGVGFALLDRLPLEELSGTEARAAYWLFGLLLGRPYYQASHGDEAELLFDIKDYSPVAVEPDEPLPPKLEEYGRLAHGARGDMTNSRLVMHTDFSHALQPPRYVGLLCLQTAMEGGQTRLVSWHSVFNELWAHHPDLARRGFRAFLQHRQQIQSPDEPPLISKPLFTYDGGLRMQYSSRLVRTGYREAGVEMDEETERFLNTVDEIVQRPEMRTEFCLQPGQIQFVTNDECGHERTEYKDHPEPEKRRLLVRLHLLEHAAGE